MTDSELKFNHCCVYEWNLKEFELITYNRLIQRSSPVFNPLHGCSARFFFHADCKKVRIRFRDVIMEKFTCTVSLKTLGDIPSMLKASHETSVHDQNGKVIAEEKSSNLTLSNNELCCLNYCRSIENQAARFLPLPNNVFVLKCKLKFNDLSLNSKTISLSRPEPFPRDLVQDLKNIYTLGTMSDVLICIGNTTLPAHKVMLAARSPVFQKMLEHECVESKSNCITITDCDDIKMFGKFLSYFYTGQLEDQSWNTAMVLYALADKYDVQGLRTTCAEIIINHLTTKPVDEIAGCVCQILKLAYEHSDDKLKNLATKLIVKHFAAVGSRPEWRELLFSEPELSSEVLVTVTSTYKPSSE